MAAKIKTGDNVVVLTGKDKGRTGEVMQVMPKDNKAVVRGVNMIVRHQKQTQAQEGGLIRKDRMYEFLDRLITIALPRVKDFRGLKPTSFDGRGNYAMGLKEHIVFPEINYDQIDQMWGMDIIVCTTAKTDEEAKALLTEFKFPFVN